MIRFLIPLLFFLPPVLSVAQTDSVTVSGRILNLTPRLYRQSPNVLISRNNLLQANAELTRPAPLNPNGTYSVKMPVVFGQEEMYFSFASVSTAFLAAPGSITINLNADSLFRVAVPFVFGGVNARVNTQYAHYKAFEAKQPKIDNEKLSKQISRQELAKAFTKVRTTYYEPFSKFSRVENPFPLVKQWVLSVNQHNAASFIYDMATSEARSISRSLDDSLRPPNDPILTAARTVSVERMGNFVLQYQGGSGTLPVSDLTSLLLRYGKQLTDSERENLTKWQQARTARTSDLRQMQKIMERNSDTLQRLVNYQLLINRAMPLMDSASRQTLTAYWLANSLPTLTLDQSLLLYGFARPQLTDKRLIQSLDELYGMAVGDSVRIRRAVAQLSTKKVVNFDVNSGVFVTRDNELSGSQLVRTWAKTNRSRLVYALLWSPADENSLRSMALAQRLRDVYPPNELTLLYIGLPSEDPKLREEYIVRNNLKGDHLLLTTAQYETLGFNNFEGGTLLDRSGNVVKRNVPLPDQFDELSKQIQKQLTR
ncbi:MAG: hypothetical protein LH609_16775 [Rudanella sp.]|nr:hypothetical protein [Rudanella sp.]